MPSQKTNKKPKNLHDGHRSRVKEQLLSGGFGDSTPPHILLETLLFFSVPRRDTNPIAHRLLNAFGSIENVLNAPQSELLKIEGVTKNTVALFRILGRINRQVASDRASKVEYVYNHDDIGKYMLKRFEDLHEEHTAVLFLKASGKILSFDILGKGDIVSVGVSARMILERAIKYDAAIAVLAHNHPSGVALPTQADIEVTKGLVTSLSHVGMKLADHVIVADGDFVSLAQSQQYKNIF